MRMRRRRINRGTARGPVAPGRGTNVTHYRRGGSRGSVLLYVVWIVLLLSLFASGVGSRALFALDLSDRLLEQLRAGYIARGAVQSAALVLARDPLTAVDGLNDPWADAPGLFQDQRLAGGRFTILAEATGEEGARYGLTDEERWLNLNTAPAKVLQRLGETVGGLRERQAIELAAAIEDWRDEDHDERPFGAEGFYYRSLSDAYDCKDGPFENVEELLLVRGVTPDLYRRLNPYLTVQGSGQVNLNTAGPEVLRALGLSEVGVAGVRYFRAGEDNQEGTSDDRQLVSVAGMESEWTNYVPAEDLAALKQLADEQLFAVRSTAFRMSIDAHTEHPSSRMRVSCVIDREGTVKAWTEW